MTFDEGALVYVEKEGFFEVFHILKLTHNAYYVKTFWPVLVEPNQDQLNALETRTTCTVLSINELETAKQICTLAVSELDHLEIDQFNKIRASKELRMNRFEQGLVAAHKLFEKHEYAQVISLLNELAPYNKTNLIIYELRGKAYIGIGNFNDAKYDLEYLLSQDDSRDDIRKMIASLGG